MDEQYRAKIEKGRANARAYLEFGRWIRNRVNNDLSDGQLDALLLLGSFRETNVRFTQKVLTKYFDSNFSSTADIVRKLQRSRLVELVGQEDTRGKELKLTDLGVKKYETLLSYLQGNMDMNQIGSEAEDFTGLFGV